MLSAKSLVRQGLGIFSPKLATCRFLTELSRSFCCPNETDILIDKQFWSGAKRNLKHANRFSQFASIHLDDQLSEMLLFPNILIRLLSSSNCNLDPTKIPRTVQTLLWPPPRNPINPSILMALSDCAMVVGPPTSRI